MKKEGIQLRKGKVYSFIIIDPPVEKEKIEGSNMTLPPIKPDRNETLEQMQSISNTRKRISSSYK